MGLSDAVLWWEEWQLRILVLGSLFVQCFLAFAAPLRKHPIGPSLRFCIWLTYLGSDAMAIYALATLFNRHKKPGGTADGSRGLEVMWAPVLLIHLAGQDAITAYNVEDNELWRRHIVTVISQVTVAIYVFCKSWSGDDSKLLRTSILLFIAGILKCGQKPFSFRDASIYSIESSLPKEDESVKIDDNDKKVSSVEDYIVAAKDCYNKATDGEDKNFIELLRDKGLRLALMPFRLFIDHAYAYKYRLSFLRSFLSLSSNDSDEIIQTGLGNSFTRLYTSENRRLVDPAFQKSPITILIRELALALTFAAIGLFHQGSKQGYNDSDVKVTYTLICCTAVLETLSFNLGSFTWGTWCESFAQYNLISFFAREKRPTNLLKLAHFRPCKEFVDPHCYVGECKSSNAITELVINQVEAGWKDRIKDTQSYWIFNDRRGQLTILQEKCDKELLRKTIQAPFDESVLVWHIATDICFYEDEEVVAAADQTATRCIEISNYMFYLLAVNPDMLMTGTRKIILSDVRKVMRSMLEDWEASASEGKKLANSDMKTMETRATEQHQSTSKDRDHMEDDPCLLMAQTISCCCNQIWRWFDDDQSAAIKGDLTREIHKRAKSKEFSGNVTKASTEELVLNASKLASQLLELDGEMRWRMMQGVWVEMLCFSASRCKGYSHAKSLANGGEYLTYVWLLLSHMGMESMAERQQRSEFGWQGVEAAGTESSIETAARHGKEEIAPEDSIV